MNINNINVPINIGFGTDDKELRIPHMYEPISPEPSKINKRNDESPSIILKSHIPENMYSSYVNEKEFHDSHEYVPPLTVAKEEEFHDSIGDENKIESLVVEKAAKKFASDKLTKEILGEMSEMEQMGMEDVNVGVEKNIKKLTFSEEDLSILQNIFNNTRVGKDKLQGLYIKGDPVAIQVREKPFVKIEDDVYDVETRIEHNKKPSFIWETSYDKLSSSLPIWLNGIWKFQKKNNNNLTSSENVLITTDGIYRLTINPGNIPSESIDAINKSLRRGILKYTQSIYFNVDTLQNSLKFIEYFNSKFTNSEMDYIPYDSKNDSVFVPYKLLKSEPGQEEPLQLGQEPPKLKQEKLFPIRQDPRTARFNPLSIEQGKPLQIKPLSIEQDPRMATFNPLSVEQEKKLHEAETGTSDRRSTRDRKLTERSPACQKFEIHRATQIFLGGTDSQNRKLSTLLRISNKRLALEYDIATTLFPIDKVDTRNNNAVIISKTVMSEANTCPQYRRVIDGVKLAFKRYLSMYGLTIYGEDTENMMLQEKRNLFTKNPLKDAKFFQNSLHLYIIRRMVRSMEVFELYDHANSLREYLENHAPHTKF